MMSAAAIPFDRRTAPLDAVRARNTRRLLVRWLLAVLDRLVPPHDPARKAEPPPEWYKYPPF